MNHTVMWDRLKKKSGSKIQCPKKYGQSMRQTSKNTCNLQHGMMQFLSLSSKHQGHPPKKTNSSHLKRDHFKRKGWSSNHHFFKEYASFRFFRDGIYQPLTIPIKLGSIIHDITQPTGGFQGIVILTPFFW